MNTKLIDALQQRNHQPPPIWLMRQAGRYLPEYRSLKEKHSFLEMCHTPELVTEITLQPLRRFGMDAAILFSDILVILEALDAGLEFVGGAGPVIHKPVRTPNDLDALPKIKVREKLSYVKDAIEMLLPKLEVPLLGFAGAPFTVASYLIEGAASKDLRITKKWMYSDPESFHKLLNLIADYTADYLNMQGEAGVCGVQIFDSWANVLSQDDFRQFALPAMERIIKQLQPDLKVILFCRGSSFFAQDLASLKPACVSVDWTARLPDIRKQLGTKITLQGNFDPCLLYAPQKVIKQKVTELMDEMGPDPAWIVNLGHGIYPDMPIESVHTLVETVQNSNYAKI